MHPILALGSPEIIMIIIGLGVLLFGAEKLPKLARSAGLAKKEFMVGQAEADLAAAKAREDARVRAQEAGADVMDNVSQNNASGTGADIPPPTTDKGTLSG
ncbi:MAG TPA: twin-arginine translocase TatA/TatE family subunit [Candidatus Rubrimentiphilum sp.]|nr:twin-arginine translocase TatA/TatE family subunit [Candidatus Rubrimentiphilum sp.]